MDGARVSRISSAFVPLDLSTDILATATRPGQSAWSMKGQLAFGIGARMSLLGPEVLSTGLNACGRNCAKRRSCSFLALALKHVRDRQLLRHRRRLSGRLILSGAWPCLGHHANRQCRSIRGPGGRAGNSTSAWKTLPSILAYMCNPTFPSGSPNAR